jgi:hypothetical protein
MHYFSEINRDNFFRFDKNMIKNKIWCTLPTASKAVYPAIGVFCNQAGVAFPSEMTLAACCGLTPKSVRNGVRSLEGVPGFTADYYVNSRGQRAHKYHLAPTPQTGGRAFPFFRKIIDGGNWSQTSEAGKALYPVMRHFGFYELYSNDNSTGDFIEDFKDRDFEFCDADKKVLQEFSGLSLKSVYNGLKSLADTCLIESEGDMWKIFVRPDISYKRDFLNKETQKLLRCEVRDIVKITGDGV